MSRTFLTLGKAESLKVSKLSVDNALGLKDTAISAANKNNFGVATSLMILSTEEIIKAQALFFQGIGIHIQKIKNANKLFSSHTNKHQFASVLQLSKVVEGIIKADEYKPQNKEYETGVTFVNYILKGLQGLRNILTPVALIGEAIEEMKDNIELLEKANDLKNMGFYVDYKNELRLPADIPSDTFQKFLALNKECFNLYRIIKLSYEKSLDQKDQEIITSTINNQIIPYLKEFYISKTQKQA